MGIEANIASVIVREHAWRPIQGDVLLLGRQTMFFAPDRAQQLVRAAGLDPAKIDFQPEGDTRASNAGYISDRDFFRLLGVQKIKALDVSAYEGADIVHDLTVPIPPELNGIADFILDGSTLDNVFDPAAVLRNITKLLRPGGRFVSVNVGSNSYGPYLIPTIHWLLDYFVMNGYRDCKIYAMVYGGPDGQINAFAPDLSLLRRGMMQVQNFITPHIFAICIMGEKGDTSTWDVSPVQHQYREDWGLFERNLAVLTASNRPDLARSTGPCFVSAPEYWFIDEMGQRQRGSSASVS